MMKKILIIDDSALMRRVVSAIINETHEYTVAYTAANGEEGLKIIESQKDILAVICDVNMPKMTGFELLSTIHEKGIYIPFILLSSRNDAAYTIAALELGALDFLRKPENLYHLESHNDFSDKLITTLKLAEEVKNKPAPTHLAPIKAHAKTENALGFTPVKAAGNKQRLVALVSSTGGPRALKAVIPKLPGNLAAPVVMVQHMPVSFTATLAERLNELSAMKVCEAADGDVVKKGHVYLAKGGKHLKVIKKNNQEYITLDDSPAVVGLKPCGNLMYDSLVDSIYDEIVCVVLTGMGADGTKGIVNLAKHKKVYVIAQNEASSTVYGMPRAIYEAGLCDEVCDLNDIAKEITKKVGVL
ncbi:MAG: chemotaxis-specific protein-glutamate methyltransferase CheB [Lachnospiraceae bacterium]|nr:chemotaxis-specific protein-glutamate methyltransferase CheB [Lachnospiraceae bacterium]